VSERVFSGRRNARFGDAGNTHSVSVGSKISCGREHSAVVSIRAGAGTRQLAPLSTQTKSNARRDSFRPAQTADTQSRPEVLYYTEIPASVGARNSARQRPQKWTRIIPLDGSFGCGVGRRRRVDRYTDPPGVPASRIRSVYARTHCGTVSCQSGQSRDKLGAASYRELKFDRTAVRSVHRTTVSFSVKPYPVQGSVRFSVLRCHQRNLQDTAFSGRFV